MSEHTPGPWTWGENFDGLYGFGKVNEVLTYVAYENMWLSFGHSREDDARLIAAAEDSLEALKGALDSLLCVKAIAKALGQS